MPIRKSPLLEGKTYHILSKSIAEFVIYRNRREYERMVSVFEYYREDSQPLKFSAFLKIKNKAEFLKRHFKNKNASVKIIAYCLMPTHIHLILKQLKPNGISIFMQRISSGYSHYF